MESKILLIINEILEGKGENKINALSDEMSLRGVLGFDSMDLAVLTARIDEEYGVDIFEDGIVDSIKEIKQKLGI